MTQYIYVIGPKNPPVKIGITNNIKQRLKSLQTGHSEKLYVHHTEEVTEDQVRIFENIIHLNLKLKKTHGEWFDISIEDAILEIKWCIIRFSEETNLKIKKKYKLLK